MLGYNKRRKDITWYNHSYKDTWTSLMQQQLSPQKNLSWQQSPKPTDVLWPWLTRHGSCASETDWSPGPLQRWAEPCTGHVQVAAQALELCKSVPRQSTRLDEAPSKQRNYRNHFEKSGASWELCSVFTLTVVIVVTECDLISRAFWKGNSKALSQSTCLYKLLVQIISVSS